MSNQQPQPGPGGEPERERPSPEGDGSPFSGAPPSQGPYGPSPYGGPGGTGGPPYGMPPLASRGLRLIARIIDALLVSIPVYLILWALTLHRFDRYGGLGSVVVLLVYFVYEGWMLSTRGQTVGKMLVRIRVAMLATGAVPQGGPGWIRAAVYSLPQLVPCLGALFWLVNVLFCTWDTPYRQCLHDKGARTVVVSSG